MKKNIYVINLKRSPDRKKHIKEQLSSKGMNFNFIEAVDGKGKSLDFFISNYDVDKNMLKRVGKELMPNEIACYLSHIKAIKKAYDDGTDYAVILEDDIYLHDSFKKAYDSSVGYNEYDSIRYEEHKRKDAYDKDVILLPRYRYKGWSGGLAYAITRTGMKKVLATAFPIYAKLDNWLWGICDHGMSIGVTNKNLIYYKKEDPSDIDYTNRKKVKKSIWYKFIWWLKSTFLDIKGVFKYFFEKKGYHK